MNALQLHELEEIETIDTEQREQFKITDLSSLNWVLRKLAAIEVKKNEVNEMINGEISRLERFRQGELSKLTDNAEFFNGLIAEYAEQKRIQDPKFRDVTPYGSVTYHKQQPKWTYDDQTLVEHLEQNELDDFIRIKKEPDKTEIKRQFKVDKGRVYDVNGVEVAGVKVEEQPDKLVVKVGE